MPRAGISYGILTTQNQGGGVKKQGLPPNIGKNQFNFRLIKRKAYPSKQPEAEAGCPEKVVEIPPGTQYTSNASLEIFRGCTKIIGTLSIGGSFQPTFSIFDCLEEITETLDIEINTSFTSISGFGRLRTVHDISIGNTTSLTSISGFENLLTISGFFEIFQNASLTSISGFGNLTSVGYVFQIFNNTLLTNISGFESLQTVGLQVVGAYFTIVQNGNTATPNSNNVVTTVTGFGNLITVPKGIAGTLNLEGISGTKLLGIASAIVTNLSDATTGTVTTTNLYTA